MKKRVIVLSLGGSMIIQENINTIFLDLFKKILKSNTSKYKFVVVCGGGSTARKYISGLENTKISSKTFHQGLLGIASTRLNARFMTYFFGEDANKGIPHDLKEVKNMLKKHDIVFCGALRYAPNETSDGTSAKLADYLETEFINITDVNGLYDKNPKTHKNAKFISNITWNEFNKRANISKFTPGQHFVLDQSASEMILKNRIKTYIVGTNLNNLNNILKNRKFVGTIIEG